MDRLGKPQRMGGQGRLRGGREGGLYRGSGLGRSRGAGFSLQDRRNVVQFRRWTLPLPIPAGGRPVRHAIEPGT
ncbi:hypothetical protein C9E82_05670 [Paracoccus siganidrum]|nr:hypothetical protein C9E82_05670 [Paracoccus siganidrum]